MQETAETAAIPTAKPGRHSLGTLTGAVLFGLATLTFYVIVEMWDSLGKPWGPGVSGTLALLFYVLHLVLIRGRVAAFDPVVWVPVSMLIFYFGLVLAVGVLDPDHPLGYDSWKLGRSPSLERGYAAHLLGVVAFLWGTHLAGLVDLSGGPQTQRERDDSLANPSLVMTAGAMVMIAGGIVIVGPSTVFGYYEDWWAAKQAGADARWIDMGLIFAMGGVFGILASDDPKKPLRRWFAIGVTLFLAIIMIQKGDRSTLIALGVGAGWCYTQRVRRIPPALVAIGACVALMALPMIKEWRTYRSVNTEAIADPGKLVGATFYEMGSSANAFVYTLDLVPGVGEHTWGMTYVDAFLRNIPNIGLTPGKSFVFEKREYHPSGWLTWQLSPIWYEQGGGYGFSMDAEWYYNFGMPAVALGMAFFGWLTGRIRNSSQGSALKLVASALFFAAMAIYVRNIIGYPLKIATWPIVGFLIFKGIAAVIAGPKLTPSPATGALARGDDAA